MTATSTPCFEMYSGLIGGFSITWSGLTARGVAKSEAVLRGSVRFTCANQGEQPFLEQGVYRPASVNSVPYEFCKTPHPMPLV